MSATTTFHSPTSTDAQILTAFEKIAEELGQFPERSPVTVVVMDGFQSSPNKPLAFIKAEPFAQFAEKNEGALWQRASIAFEPLGLTVSLNRDREMGDDVIQVTWSKEPYDPAAATKSLFAIQSQFVPLNRAAQIKRALGPEMAEFYQRREEGLTRLENLTRKLVTETHDYRMKLDAEMAQQRQELATSFAEQHQALEKKYAERTTALEVREQDLDDRSARHARRKLSRALQQKIAERSEKFTLTPDTELKRRPIHRIFAVLLALTGGLIIRSLLFPATATEGVALWLEVGRLPLGVVGFALTSIFYIRWNDQWFRQHADQEFRLQQLALDVDRAGYVTEMLLEWQEDKGSEMPAVMVDRLTTGLFTDQTKAGTARHPSEDLTAALMKAAGGVRVNLPDIGEASLSGRQIRKLDKNLARKGNE